MKFRSITLLFFVLLLVGCSYEPVVGPRRFDPAADLHPASRTIRGNRLVFDFPILIDARWKKGYPQPVEFDPDVQRKVHQRWDSYGIDLNAS